MDKIQKIILLTGILLLLLAGFTITINKFHWEFRGLISIVFKLIYGEDL